MASCDSHYSQNKQKHICLVHAQSNKKKINKFLSQVLQLRSNCMPGWLLRPMCAFSLWRLSHYSQYYQRGCLLSRHHCLSLFPFQWKLSKLDGTTQVQKDSLTRRCIITRNDGPQQKGSHGQSFFCCLHDDKNQWKIAKNSVQNWPCKQLFTFQTPPWP